MERSRYVHPSTPTQGCPQFHFLRKASRWRIMRGPPISINISISPEARLVAKAHEDYYEQLMTDAAHDKRNLTEEVTHLKTDGRV